MTKRPLTDEEIKFSQKSIERLNKENEFLQYQKEIKLLAIEKGLRLVFEMQLQKTKDELKGAEEQLKHNQAVITLTEQQIKYGVEPKEE